LNPAMPQIPLSTQRKILRLEQQVFNLKQKMAKMKDEMAKMKEKHEKEIAELKTSRQPVFAEEQRQKLIALRERALAKSEKES
jgi:hypothetical protein